MEREDVMESRSDSQRDEWVTIRCDKIKREEGIIKWAWILMGYSSKRGFSLWGEGGLFVEDKSQIKPCLRVLWGFR